MRDIIQDLCANLREYESALANMRASARASSRACSVVRFAMAHRRLSGQNAAASARPRAPLTTSFSSRLTRSMATFWPEAAELTVPRQCAPG